MKQNIKKVKIKENKTYDNINNPKFSINYSKIRSENEKKQISYEIISKLKKNKDVIIEINTELLHLIKSSRKDFFLEFMDSIDKLGLSYRKRKLPPSKINPFSLEILQRKEDNYEAYVYIPASIWENPDLVNLLPIYGIKYYIINEPDNTDKILDDLNSGRIIDNEMLNNFDIIFFDSIYFGLMGIFTKILTLDYIKKIIIQ